MTVTKPRKMSEQEFLEKAAQHPELVAKWSRIDRRRLDVLRRRNATKTRLKARVFK